MDDDDKVAWAISIGLASLPILGDQILNACGVQVKLTMDVLQELQSTKDIRSAVRDIWTQLGLVSALVLTLVFQMLQTNLPDDAGMNLQHVYVGLCGGAVITCLLTTTECIILLVYTEHLSDANALRFIICFPGSIGGPVVKNFMSYLFAVLGLISWVLAQYTLAAAAGLGLGALIALVFVLVSWVTRSCFTLRPESPWAAKYRWAEKGDEAGCMDPRCTKAAKQAMIRLLHMTMDECEDKGQGKQRTTRQEQLSLEKSAGPLQVKPLSPMVDGVGLISSDSGLMLDQAEGHVFKGDKAADIEDQAAGNVVTGDKVADVELDNDDENEFDGLPCAIPS
ncbi:unnamed protein product [Polarella glacialis]|uniref:Uncharacterized protein n=1 Tax=Polarella glacialis TaxID=89957 RepID=A0A813HUH8_POLGL|nr:unnamed protein product [Polarella glacialis]